LPTWIVRPEGEAVHREATGAQAGEPSDLPALDRCHAHRVTGRAGDRAGIEIDLKLALGKPAARRVGRLHLAVDLRVGPLEGVEQFA
jgi:hypothetical protein